MRHVSLMESLLGLQVRRVRNFWRIEHPKKVRAPIQSDASLPSAMLVRRLANTTKTGMATATGCDDVLIVDRASGFPQVAQSVVRLYSVNVIDGKRGPLAVVMEPSQAMRRVRPSVDANRDVPTRIDETGSGAGHRFFSAVDTPSELPSLGFVVNKSAQFLRGKLSASHSDSLTVGVVRSPPRVSALGGLRHFICQHWFYQQPLPPSLLDCYSTKP